MQTKAPDDFMVWGIALVIGSVFLFALPKFILVIAIAGLVMGYANIGLGRK
jgi:hypothetical protein